MYYELTAPERAGVAEAAFGLQLLDQLIKGQILMGISAQRHLPHPASDLPKLGSPDRSVRSASGSGRSRSDPSVSGRVRLANRCPPRCRKRRSSATENIVDGQQGHEERCRSSWPNRSSAALTVAFSEKLCAAPE